MIANYNREKRLREAAEKDRSDARLRVAEQAMQIITLKDENARLRDVLARLVAAHDAPACDDVDWWSLYTDALNAAREAAKEAAGG
jgi:hypothetical protein